MQYTRSARPVFCKNKTQKARTKHKKMKESSMNVRFTLSLRSLATAGIIALALPLAAQATNITFTNAVLKAYVVAHYDKDGDSEISEAEALLVTVIKVSGGYDMTGTKTEIASFSDIANFPNLDPLDCSFNSLTSLDVSKNTSLTVLYCNGNLLTSLDISKNTSLTVLYCNNNQLTTLDVSKNTSLTCLCCAGNKLTSLDVSKNTSLTVLYCNGNLLTSLDISKNTSLTVLYCNNNQLTTLDVSKNTSLTCLCCAGNKLTSLDVSKNTSLTCLCCNDNKLTSLDVSKNTSLTTLFCYYNRLMSLDVSKNTKLTELNCFNNQLMSLDVSKNTKLTVLGCYGNRLTRVDARTMAAAAVFCGNQDIDGNGSPSTAETDTLFLTAVQLTAWNVYYKSDERNTNVVATSAIPFTDAVLKAYVVAHYDGSDGTAKDGEISEAEALLVTNISVPEGYDMTAAQSGTKTKIASFADIANNTNLDTLNCGSNQLTSLDVSKNTSLTYLNCGSNQLTSLDVSKNTELSVLDCYGNRLTRRDARTMAAAEVYCGNQDETDTLFLTDAQLTEWNKSYKSDENNANVVATSAIPFTDAVLKAYVVAHYDGSDGTAKDGEISEAEALLVTAINVSGGYDTTVAQSGTKTKIASFADIANFPNLDTLDCSGNQFTSLDVSKNTSLTYLACYDNQLTSLDVSANTLLTYLGCGYNQLTSLDVSANTSLTQLSCNGNRLTRLDARTMAAAEVYCGNQDINGDGSPSTAETDTLFLTASQLTKWNASYKSDEYNTNVVATSATPFTDAVLKAYVVAHYDGSDGTAKDGEISEAEALLVTVIKVYGGYDTTAAQSGTKTKIASFADIANFPNLDTLDCSGNELAVLDVSKNTKLTYLACYDNQLTSLDVSKNTKLTYLDCHNNQLASLDVSKNTELTVLYCAYDQLTSLDVSANTSLATLFCYHNRFTSLDVSKNTKLMYLDCSLNSLTSVDVSKNTKLTQFYCHNNQLTSVDVSTNTSLKLLFCQGNRLTRVDARTRAAAEVYCGNQDIDGDGSPSTAETDTLFLTASQLTKWNASYKSDERNTNIVAYGFVTDRKSTRLNSS